MAQESNTADIAGVWLALQRARDVSANGYSQHLWIIEEITKLIERHPDEAWNFVLRVLSMDSSDDILENLAAGPLEDLLSMHGDRFIAVVESEAQRNPLFRILLGGVWQANMSDAVWKRVSAAADRHGWDCD